jgi:hypothetical protein
VTAIYVFLLFAVSAAGFLIGVFVGLFMADAELDA